MYHYGGNNPVKYVDPDGKWIQFLVGASVGALLSGVSAAVDSYISDGTINWNTVAISAGSGAVSGMIAASGIGLSGQIALNGLLGAAAGLPETQCVGIPPAPVASDVPKDKNPHKNRGLS